MNEATLWTELSARPQLRQELWPEGQGSFVERFSERELRRELLSAAIRLGHPMVDLWLEGVRDFEALTRREEDERSGSPQQLARRFLDRLQTQREAPGPSSYRELREIAQNFHLIIDVNFPELRDKKLVEVPRYLADTLGQQSPVAGMWGQVTPRTVKQFRMPGYPLILVTTDVLREGEDLHTFCHQVVHYGITWTSSAMEQRTGRIDRIGSLTHRRLRDSSTKNDERFIQVFYPYLADTVELVQVQEVFRRMNGFLEMLHESRREVDKEESAVRLERDILEGIKVLPQIKTRLQTAFGVRRDWLPEGPKRLAIDDDSLARPEQAFDELVNSIGAAFGVDWELHKKAHWRGTAYLSDGAVLAAGSDRRSARRQPFEIDLRTSVPGGRSLIRLSSPIGLVHPWERARIELIQQHELRAGPAKVCATPDDVHGGYQLALQVDVLFSPSRNQRDTILSTLRRLLRCADDLEKELLGMDQSWAQLDSPPEEAPDAT